MNSAPVSVVMNSASTFIMPARTERTSSNRFCCSQRLYSRVAGGIATSFDTLSRLPTQPCDSAGPWPWTIETLKLAPCQPISFSRSTSSSGRNRPSYVAPRLMPPWTLAKTSPVYFTVNAMPCASSAVRRPPQSPVSVSRCQKPGGSSVGGGSASCRCANAGAPPRANAASKTRERCQTGARRHYAACARRPSRNRPMARSISSADWAKQMRR